MKMTIDNISEKLDIPPLSNYVLTPSLRVPFKGGYENTLEWRDPNDDDFDNDLVDDGKIISTRWDYDSEQSDEIDFLAIFTENDNKWSENCDRIPRDDYLCAGEIETPEKKYCVLSFDNQLVNIAKILGQVLSYDEMAKLIHWGNKHQDLWHYLQVALENLDAEMLAEETNLPVRRFQPLIDKVAKKTKEQQSQLG